MISSSNQTNNIKLMKKFIIPCAIVAALMSLTGWISGDPTRHAYVSPQDNATVQTPAPMTGDESATK